MPPSSLCGKFLEPGACDGNASALSSISLLRLGSTLEGGTAEGTEGANLARSVGSIHPRVLSTKNSVLDRQAELEAGGLA